MHDLIQCSVASNPFLVEVESTFRPPFDDDQLTILFDYYTVLTNEDIPDDDEMVLRIESVQYKQISYSYIPKKYYILLHDNALMCEAMGILMKDSHKELYEEYKNYFDKKRNTSSFANLLYAKDKVNPLFASLLLRNTQNGVLLYKYGGYYSALHKLLQNGCTRLDQVVAELLDDKSICNHSCFLCGKSTGEVDICQTVIVDDIYAYGGEAFHVKDVPKITDAVTCKQIEEEFANQ